MVRPANLTKKEARLKKRLIATVARESTGRQPVRNVRKRHRFFRPPENLTSARARGLSKADLANNPAEFAMPDILVRLAADAQVTLTY